MGLCTTSSLGRLGRRRLAGTSRRRRGDDESRRAETPRATKTKTTTEIERERVRWKSRPKKTRVSRVHEPRESTSISTSTSVRLSVCLRAVPTAGGGKDGRRRA